MKQETIDILTAEVKEYVKPGPGGTKYKYIKGEDVITRLNAAFKHDWNSKVVNIIESGNQIIVLVEITAEGITHQGFGGSEIAVYRDGPKKGSPVDMSNSYKSALTNAIKKAAEQFGVGLSSEDEVVYNSYTDYNATQANNRNDAVSASVTVSASNKQRNIGVDINNIQKQLEGILNSPTNSGQVSNESAPTRPAQTSAPKENTTQTNSTPFPPSSDPNDKINDIQLSALSGLARMKKIEPEKAILNGLPSSTKTKYEDLTREEAKVVILALNSLKG